MIKRLLLFMVTLPVRPAGRYRRRPSGLHPIRDQLRLSLARMKAVEGDTHV
ncbi:hypothetical protein RHI9324_03974 [Rhizobium sp. CECT 9324]|nr:hypothetical protein RHI9324_03974 [Rhizobium sp. CECT 9324]